MLEGNEVDLSEVGTNYRLTSNLMNMETTPMAIMPIKQNIAVNKKRNSIRPSRTQNLCLSTEGLMDILTQQANQEISPSMYHKRKSGRASDLSKTNPKKDAKGTTLLTPILTEASQAEAGNSTTKDNLDNREIELVSPSTRMRSDIPLGDVGAPLLPDISMNSLNNRGEVLDEAALTLKAQTKASKTSG